MSADRDVTRTVRSWLHEDAHEDADRVLSLVLDEIDTTPQRRASWLARRFPPMSNTLRIALATAAVVVLAFLGIRFLGGGINIGAPSRTDTASPSPTPIAFSAVRALVLIPPGPLILDGKFPLAIEFTVPRGWSADGVSEAADVVAIKRPKGDQTPLWVAFAIVRNVFPDPCHPVGMDPPLGPTVDDLVNALRSMTGFVAGNVSDVQIDGHPGKQLEMATSVNPAFPPCDDQTKLSIWTGAAGTTEVLPGPTSLLITIVDVNGTRLVMWRESYGRDYGGTTPAELAEANAILNSVRFR